MSRITRSTTLAEILKVPQAEEVLHKHKLPCLNCPFAQWEMENLKIGDICKIYHLNLKSLLADLNNIRKKGNSSR